MEFEQTCWLVDKDTEGPASYFDVQYEHKVLWLVRVEANGGASVFTSHVKGIGFCVASERDATSGNQVSGLFPL